MSRRRLPSVRRLVETAAWCVFGATLLGTAAFAPMGCTPAEVPPSVAAPEEAEAAERAAATPDPVVAAPPIAAPPPVAASTTPGPTTTRPALSPAQALAARKPRFATLTTRADVTDLVLIGDTVFASSTGGVDAWTLDGERVGSWGAEDGLPGNAIVDLRHEFGRLLAAGPGGIAALSLGGIGMPGIGKRFVALERAGGADLPHRLSAAPSDFPLTTAVAVTHAGRAVGTFSGAVHLDGDLGSGVRTLPGVILHLQTVLMPSRSVSLVAVSTQGVYTIGKERGVTLLEAGDLSSAARSEAGGVLLGFRDGRIVERTPAGERHRRRRAHGAAVTALLEHGGALYFAVEGEGVRKASRRGLKRFRPRVDTCFNHVGALARWQGRVVIGGFDGGLCELGEEGPRRRWRAPSPLPSDIILSLAVSDETLWVGTSYGVAHLEPRKGRKPRVRSFLPSFKNRYALSAHGIVGMARGDEHLWIADGRGVSQISVADDRDVVRHRAEPGLPEGLTDVAAAGEHVWAATEHDGVSQRTDAGWVLHTAADGLAEAWVTKVAAAADGRAWAGHSMRGLSLFDGQRWSTLDETGGLPDGAVVSLAYDAALDVLWVGTLGGLAVVGGDGQVLGAWDSRDGLPDPRVHALLIDDDKLWVATEGGLAVIDDRRELVSGLDKASRG